jgi:hypothetical protein
MSFFLVSQYDFLQKTTDDGLAKLANSKYGREIMKICKEIADDKLTAERAFEEIFFYDIRPKLEEELKELMRVQSKVRRGGFVKTERVSKNEDEFGTLYTLRDVKFTGDIASDVRMLQEDPYFNEWLWGELETDAAITDAAGYYQYVGADVQDFYDPEIK